MGSDADIPPPNGTRVTGRPWGFWTEAKLQLLADYLDRFTTATKHKATERIYLDLFAGEGHGISRTTGESFKASPRIALDVDDPAFTQLRFFELPPTAQRLETSLRADYPDRPFRVVPGDCNDTVSGVLAELKAQGLAWAPTFAFADPDGIKLRWTTLRSLSEHKRGSNNKIELWILLSSAGLMRVLRKNITALTPDEEEQATQVYGSERWTSVQALRTGNDISPAQARDEFVNLYRWQLHYQLSYRWVHALEIRTLHDRPLYHMVFATDNDAGNRIMAHLYNTAAARWPVMRQYAKARMEGQQTLFGPADVAVTEQMYRYEPPWEPPS
jgi:three-Cys-motif partner protein